MTWTIALTFLLDAAGYTYLVLMIGLGLASIYTIGRDVWEVLREPAPEDILSPEAMAERTFRALEEAEAIEARWAQLPERKKHV